MIDPEILQQHFRSIQKKELIKDVKIENTLFTNTLEVTSMQVIPIQDTDIVEEVKTNEIPKLELQTELAPLTTNDVNKDKEIYESTNNTLDDYNPYGYYSGPKF